MGIIAEAILILLISCYKSVLQEHRFNSRCTKAKAIKARKLIYICLKARCLKSLI